MANSNGKIIIVSESFQLFVGFVLLCLVICTWCQMSKLKTLLLFIKKLLLGISLKALALMAQSALLLSISLGDENNKPFEVLSNSACEYVNWVSTQTVIFIVAMRFYESSLPVKLLQKNLQATQDTADKESQPEDKSCLGTRRRRNLFSVFMLTAIVVATTISIIFYALLQVEISNESTSEDSNTKWFILASVTLTLTLCCQIVPVVLLLKSYRTIRGAAVTLEVTGEVDQTSRQLCLMLFNSILITISYLFWYVADLTLLYLRASNKISADLVFQLIYTGRLLRLLLQAAAFGWILLTFARYGIRVDERMERLKSRRSTRRVKKKPVVTLERLDSVPEPENKPNPSSSLLRSKTIDADTDSESSMSSPENSDEELEVQERLLQKEIIKNFVAIKKIKDARDFSYEGNISKQSFQKARFSLNPDKRKKKRAADYDRQSEFLNDSLAEIEEDLSSGSDDHNC